MDTLGSSSSEAEVIPERIKKFLTVLSNPSGMPNIRVCTIAQEKVVYSIPNPEGGIPICINTDELADFLFPNIQHISLSHRDALVQAIFKAHGFSFIRDPNSTIPENDRDFPIGYARLSEIIEQRVSSVI